MSVLKLLEDAGVVRFVATETGVRVVGDSEEHLAPDQILLLADELTELAEEISEP